MKLTKDKLIDAPEGWEENLRAKLEKEIKPGCYFIGGPGISLYTGRGGKIEYEVALQKAIKGYK